MKIQACVMITFLAVLTSGAMEKPPVQAQVKQFQPLSLQQLTMRPIIKNIIANAATLNQAINGIHKAATDNIQILNLLDNEQITNDIMKQLYDKFGAEISPDDTHYAYIDIAARLNTQGARDWYAQNYDKGIIFEKPQEKTEERFRLWLNKEFLAAIRANNLIFFNFLLNLGASIELFAGFSISPLGEAIRSDNVQVVKKLLDMGADPNGNAGFFLATPLITAIHKENPDIVRMLLEAGADQNIATPTVNVAKAVQDIQDPATRNKIIQLLKPYTEKTKLE